MKYPAIAAGAIFVLEAIVPAFGCALEGKTILWEDDFKVLDPSWRAPDANFDVQNGSAKMKVNSTNLLRRINFAGVYRNFAVCAKIVLPNADQTQVTVTTTTTEPDLRWAGLIFWFSDPDNYYAFVIDTSARAAVVRKQGGNYVFPIGFSASPDIVKGPMPNELEVITNDNNIYLYVNGKLFNHTRAIKPNDATYIGLIGQAPPNLSAQFEFEDMRVTSIDGLPALKP